MAKPIRILVVEDEAIIAMSLQMQLIKAGYTVEIATNGETALKKVALKKTDLIVLDKGLPGKMDGLEVARQIQAQYQIPIIFMTGYQDREILNEIHEMDPVACLIKPIRVEELKAIIQKLFPLSNEE